MKAHYRLFYLNCSLAECFQNTYFTPPQSKKLNLFPWTYDSDISIPNLTFNVLSFTI